MRFIEARDRNLNPEMPLSGMATLLWSWIILRTVSATCNKITAILLLGIKQPTMSHGMAPTSVHCQELDIRRSAGFTPVEVAEVPPAQRVQIGRGPVVTVARMASPEESQILSIVVRSLEVQPRRYRLAAKVAAGCLREWTTRVTRVASIAWP